MKWMLLLCLGVPGLQALAQQSPSTPQTNANSGNKEEALKGVGK
jgi:hypothetical protein